MSEANISLAHLSDTTSKIVSNLESFDAPVAIFNYSFFNQLNAGDITTAPLKNVKGKNYTMVIHGNKDAFDKIFDQNNPFSLELDANNAKLIEAGRISFTLTFLEPLSDIILSLNLFLAHLDPIKRALETYKLSDVVVSKSGLDKVEVEINKHDIGKLPNNVPCTLGTNLNGRTIYYTFNTEALKKKFSPQQQGTTPPKKKEPKIQPEAQKPQPVVPPPQQQGHRDFVWPQDFNFDDYTVRILPSNFNLGYGIVTCDFKIPKKLLDFIGFQSENNRNFILNRIKSLIRKVVTDDMKPENAKKTYWGDNTNNSVTFDSKNNKFLVKMDTAPFIGERTTLLLADPPIFSPQQDKDVSIEVDIRLLMKYVTTSHPNQAISVMLDYDLSYNNTDNNPSFHIQLHSENLPEPQEDKNMLLAEVNRLLSPEPGQNIASDLKSFDVPVKFFNHIFFEKLKPNPNAKNPFLFLKDIKGKNYTMFIRGYTDTLYKIFSQDNPLSLELDANNAELSPTGEISFTLTFSGPLTNIMNSSDILNRLVDSIKSALDLYCLSKNSTVKPKDNAPYKVEVVIKKKNIVKLLGDISCTLDLPEIRQGMKIKYTINTEPLKEKIAAQQ